MEFRIDKERRMLETGGIAAIPGDVERRGWCHEDTELVDIFAPRARILAERVGRQ